METDFYTLIWIAESEKIRYVYSKRNFPKYSNDQRGKLDWNWLKFYGERNTGFNTRHNSAKIQTTKQTFTTSKQAIEFLTRGVKVLLLSV